MPVLGKSVERREGQFLYIPLSRYIFMSVITFGLYQAYWIYKNWEYLKNRDNLKIHPFWRGIFGIFFCHELLKAIHEDSILNKTKTAQFNHSFLATGWVIVVIIQYIFNRLFLDFSNGFVFLIFFVLLMIELSFFIPVQQYINEVNEKINPSPDYYPWSAGHFVLIGLVVAIFLIAFFGAISSSSESAQATEITYHTIQTIAPLNTIAPHETIVPVKIAPNPTLINYRGKPGWLQYSNYDDHFSIYKPSDWTVSEIESSEAFGDSSQYMKKVVYIFAPNLKGFVMIYGVDFSGTLFSIFDDPNKTQISDEFYDEFVKGIKSGETDQMKFVSLEKDSNYYLINGNPARRVKVYSQINGETLNGDFYLIAHENTYYVEGFFGMEGSTQSDVSTATDIMRTFTTTS